MKKLKLGLSISGGIDSSICAFLLQKNQFYIESIFMNNWKITNQNNCNNKIDYLNAKRVSNKLNIKLNVLNFSTEYWNFVFTFFLKKLNDGKTPNPDILCNKKIKFDILLFYLLKKMKLNVLSTGHYASIEKYKKFILIKKSFDINKDQTYFLNQIKKNIKKYIIFPLSNYSKLNIRWVGKNYVISNYNKKDSVGICFIGKNKFHIFIKKYLKQKRGKIYSDKNIFLGFHDGLHFYTIGQKKHILRINKNTGKKMYYVYKKNIKTNTLYVTDKNNKKKLSVIKIGITKPNFINKKFTRLICKAKIRHGNSYHLSVISTNTYLYTTVFFKFPVQSVSIGQYIVFYKNDVCLGGAMITKIYI